jgi:hypothetical protein
MAITQESQVELEICSSESLPPSHSESSAQPCQTLALDLRNLHHFEPWKIVTFPVENSDIIMETFSAV